MKDNKKNVNGIIWKTIIIATIVCIILLIFINLNKNDSIETSDIKFNDGEIAEKVHSILISYGLVENRIINVGPIVNE